MNLKVHKFTHLRCGLLRHSVMIGYGRLQGAQKVHLCLQLAAQAAGPLVPGRRVLSLTMVHQAGPAGIR